MTDKNFDEVPENEGSDAAASGPAPDSGNIPEQDSTEAAAAEGSDETPAEADDELTIDALLNDLKRLTAEYANYRRRTEEQRHVEIARAKGEAAKGLLPVLDDLDRAQQHGDLVEGSAFSVIAEKVRAVVERLGVVAYGAEGDAFDPQHHEAIFQQPVPGATSSTILEVIEVGYRLGDVELRPAKVVVAVPDDPSAGSGPSTGSGTD